MATIRLQQVWKRYGPVEAVKNLSLACGEGELLALLGPSGCGKTSTLKMIAGIEDVSAGEVYFDDRPVSGLDPADRNVAMVFEDYALYPHLTVGENVAFPLRVRRRPTSEIRRDVDEVLALLGLEGLKDVDVRRLSGGAQQRVAIGRALVRNPDVILFDEPLSHLDGNHKVQLRGEIKRLQKEAGVTGVLVTHDQTEAMAMADRVAVMELGVLQQLAPPRELYDSPANLFVARFIGEPPMNLLAGIVRADGGVRAVEGEGWRVPLPARMAARLEAGAARDVLVGARPEHLRLRAVDAFCARRGLAGEVFFREPRGDVDVVLVRLARGERAGDTSLSRDMLAVEVPAGGEWKEGDRVEIELSPEELHIFDAPTGRNLG